MQQTPTRPAPQETSSVSPPLSRIASSSAHHTTYVDPDLANQTSIPSLSSSSNSVVNPSSSYTPVSAVPKSQGRSSFKVLSRPAKPTITTQGLDTASFSALPPVETSSSSYGGTKGTPTTSGNAGFVASPSMISPAAPLDPHMFYSPGKTAYTPTASVSPLSSRGTTLESVTHTPRSRDGSSDNVRISSGGETEVMEDDGESTGNSTGSQTPRRRQSGPLGFGFEANQSSRPSTVAGGSYTRHGMTANPGASISAPPTATPRRPSLLTQQILSSPAVPLATRMTASLNPVPTGAQLSKRSSLKERVKGSLKPSLTTHGELQHSDLGGSFRSRSSRDSFSAHSGELHHPASSPGGSNIREDHMEELRGDVNSNPIRGRARQYTRSRTYTEGSSQDEAGSSAMYGTSSGTWGRSVGGLTTDDDEAVIETQDINFTKDAVTGRKMVNQYVILKEIGRGQHGQVRLGQDISQENTSSRRNVSQTENGQWDTDKGVGQHEGGYWAIKILDRQPRKKLPGVKKLTVGYPGLTGEARQTSVTNEKLKKEIAILKKCRHPNVVRLREVIDAPVSKKIYLVLEYCEGGEVKWKTEEGKPLLTVDQARKTFRDIVLGLEYLHHQGIIHRDIKPANLLYSADGIVKISDFGVSHYSQVLRGQNTGDGDSPEEDDDLGYANEHDLAKTAGSPAFFAPELCFSDLGPPSTGSSPAREIPGYVFPAPPTNENKLDSRSSIHSAHSTSNTLRPESPAIRKERPPITEAIDVWALGVTLYCFLFGTVPFDSISEFHLLSIIPVEDFPVPDYMGADRQYTGGRKGYRKGPSSTLTKEACEVVDLLDKLLDKDPTKRIKLSDVKTHPFTLRGLNDKSVWLTTTGPSAENFVTVSTAEVAAAVTNSNSFRDKFKKGMRNLSNRLFGSNTGSLRSRSRSNSVVHLGDRSMSVSASSTSPNATHPPGSPLTGQHTRWNSGWSSRIPSGTSETSDARSSSPRPNGLVRRLSVLGGKSARSISPLPPLDRFHHISSFPNYAVPVNSDPNDRLGRSMSDRSTTSSSGNLLLGRGPPAGPIRRQSTHLVPPSSGNTDPTASRKFLSTSNSAERLGDIDQKSSADGNRLKSGRQRAISNASSVTGSASASGLHSKLAKLLTRGSSQKSSSASSVISSNVGLPYRRGSEVESSRDRLPTVGRFPTPPLDLRSRQSVETFASASAMSSRQPSPAMSFHTLPPIPQVTSFTADIEDDEEETLHTMDKATPDLDKADWEGDLSDDDDYGAPIKSVYGAHRAATSWNETPTRAADLHQGTWILNSNGWHGRSDSEAVEPGNVGSESSRAVTNDGLALDSGVPLIESGFSPSHVPPTIAEADVETDSVRLDDSPPSRAIPRDTFTSQARSPPTSPTRQLHLETGNRTYSRGCPSPARIGRGSFRENVNGNLVNRRSVDRFGIGQFQDTFDDADEDDDAADDGLEIDVATKRGRRASKPVTPAMNRQLSLPR